MKTGEITITAYEWHNHETGHCYVDYVPHPGQDEENGYTKIPLIKQIIETKGTVEDFKQYVMNLLYAATNEGPTMGNPKFDEWADKQIELLGEYMNQILPSNQEIKDESELFGEEHCLNAEGKWLFAEGMRRLKSKLTI